jgi:hypothetical protein
VSTRPIDRVRPVIQSNHRTHSETTGVCDMSKEDELREVLDEAVRSIADAQSNPRTWLAWVVYLLRRLEEKATNENPAYRESFLEMLSALQDEIRNRNRTGGWH